MKQQGENPIDKYTNVLSSGISSGSLNRGFRLHCKSIFSYSQYRQGLSYFYCKRKVHDDGITTSPLDITAILP